MSAPETNEPRDSGKSTGPGTDQRTESSAREKDTGSAQRFDPLAAIVKYQGVETLVARTERQRGQRREYAYAYEHPDGALFAVVVRFEGGGKPKSFCQYGHGALGWYVGLREERDERNRLKRLRPMFGLQDFLRVSSKLAFVVEGEKAALALRSIGLCAVTSLGGFQAPQLTDWTPLAGMSVVILPDNDDAGRKYAAAVLGILRSPEIGADVQIVTLPELPAHGDAFDFVAQRTIELAKEGEGDARRLQDTIASEVLRLATTMPDPSPPSPSTQASLPETPSKSPSKKHSPTIPPFRPFPIDTLPEPVSTFVIAAASAIGCDPSMVALPVLSVLAAAIGSSRRIRLKATWWEPAIVWIAIVAKSGMQKSAGLQVALAPLRRVQDAAMKAFAEAMKQYRSARSSMRSDSAPATDEPRCRRLIIKDTTIEAIAPILRDNPRGVLLARDELAGWVASFDAYKKSRGADVASWLEMFRGEPVLIDRKHGEEKLIYVQSGHVPVCGTIQPGTLRRALSTENFENGFASRLLAAMPPRQSRVWTEADVPAELSARYEAVVERLLALPMPDGKPVELGFTQTGKSAWKHFYNRHGEEQEALTGDLAAAWSKLEGYCARFALILHETRIAAGDRTAGQSIDEKDLANAARLIEWFGHETERIYSALHESAQQAEQRELLEYIHRRGGLVSVRDLVRGPQRFRDDQGAAEGALAQLVDAGLGDWKEQPAGAQGGRPTRALRLRDVATKPGGDETSLVSTGGNGAATKPPSFPGRAEVLSPVATASDSSGGGIPTKANGETRVERGEDGSLLIGSDNSP